MTVLVGHCVDFGDVGMPYLPLTDAGDVQPGGRAV